MKKVLATVLALVMALVLCSVSWAADEVTTAEALAAAVETGGEIKLGADIPLTSILTIPAGKTVTLDLNGCKLSRSGDAIKNNGTLTIKDTKGGGKIVSETAGGVGVGDSSVTTIENAIIESVEGAVYTGKSVGATITIKAGTFSASDNAVVAGNGSDRTGEGNTINISGGTFNGQIKTPTYVACGIYAPWKDTIKVTGGTFNITGGAGIVARAGSVSVSNATINTTGNAIGRVGDSRVVVPCSAIVFDSEAAYPALTNTSAISVESGTFTSEADTISVVKLASEDAAERVSVAGGAYSNDVSAYAGSNAVASLKNVYYVGNDSIAAAVNSMNGGDTLTVIKGSVKVGNTEYGANQTYTKPTSYYYYSPSTTTPDTTKGSPKTFDAGIALYVGMALTSVTGLAYTGKKKF